MAQASVAAGIAWQSQVGDELVTTVYSTTSSDAAVSVPPLAALQMWLDFWTAVEATPKVTDVWQTWTAPVIPAVVAGAPSWPMATVATFWNVTPWQFYQAPLMTMMLSFGIPYSVAAPTARASTCAMDAADAACTQWRLLFANQNDRQVTERGMSRSVYLH
jgi:hypothetical protein